MADENENGTPAEADAPEDIQEPEVTEAAVEAAADEPEAAADETAAADEPVAAAADEPTDEPVADAAVEDASDAVSDEVAPAEVTAKRKRKRVPRSERRTRTKVKRVPATDRKPIVRLDKPEHERGRRQERQGTVVSDAMEKTIVVRVDVVKAHPRYKKVVRRSVKFHAHDETSQAKVGDVVRIVETRPLSKTKRWRLAEVVEAAK
jgi:small subunit ribosomal protein S17